MKNYKRIAILLMASCLAACPVFDSDGDETTGTTETTETTESTESTGSAG